MCVWGGGGGMGTLQATCTYDVTFNNAAPLPPPPTPMHPPPPFFFLLSLSLGKDLQNGFTSYFTTYIHIVIVHIYIYIYTRMRRVLKCGTAYGRV